MLYRYVFLLILAEIAQKYHVNKYPTLKMFRNGELAKREYRGQRSVEALESFIQSQLDSMLKPIQSNQELESKLDVCFGFCILEFYEIGVLYELSRSISVMSSAILPAPMGTTTRI